VHPPTDVLFPDKTKRLRGFDGISFCLAKLTAYFSSSGIAKIQKKRDELHDVSDRGETMNHAGMVQRDFVHNFRDCTSFDHFVFNHADLFVFPPLSCCQLFISVGGIARE
jgi:hypothetical protein